MDDAAQDAIAFDAWDRADGDEPYDPYHDVPLDQQEGGAKWIAEHNDVVRARYETPPSAQEVSPAPAASRPRRHERVTLQPRLGGDRAARRGAILLQRARTTVSTFSTDDELRVFLAERTSWDWLELVRPTPAGRPTAAVRERRSELARLTALARAHGAGYEALARVLDRSLATVHALAGAA